MGKVDECNQWEHEIMTSSLEEGTLCLLGVKVVVEDITEPWNIQFVLSLHSDNLFNILLSKMADGSSAKTGFGTVQKGFYF